MHGTWAAVHPMLVLNYATHCFEPAVSHLPFEAFFFTLVFHIHSHCSHCYVMLSPFLPPHPPPPSTHQAMVPDQFIRFYRFLFHACKEPRKKHVRVRQLLGVAVC